MAAFVITESLKEELIKFLNKNPKSDLLTAYLFFLSKKYSIKPVLYIREKTIFQGQEELIKSLENQGKIWREAEIKIEVGQPVVNEQTQKIYICPFSGKVFGDNTHPNPLDAIYDWVSKCPENTERSNGLKVKKFYVSEDKEVIKNYIQKRKEPIKKIVYSSVTSGKIFSSKEAVIEDFKHNQLKEIPLAEVPNQNRFQIEGQLLKFIQNNIHESKLAEFVEAISDVKELVPFATAWLEE
jgi:hypothetical protein